MPSQLKLHRTFADCETEELKAVEALQGIMQLLVADESGKLLAHSSNLDFDQATSLLSRLFTEHLPEDANLHHMSGAAHDFLFHRNAQGHLVFELDPMNTRLDYEEIRLPPPITNELRYAQQICNLVSANVPYDRVFVYRFHADESGEVIAEWIEPGLEPFLGLHYPATDIPRQARALYSSVGARMVFSNTGSDLHLVNLDSTPIDISKAVCRGVSPFHLQYLQNMGSHATASIAIEVDGALWGLLSMHSENPVTPSLKLFMKLQSLKQELGQKTTECLRLSNVATSERHLALIKKFDQHLESEFDIA